MRFHLTSDPEEFAERAWPFIESRLECNVMATVLATLRDGVFATVNPLFAYGLADDGEVGFAALRTPPWFMLASELDRAHAPALIARWLEVDPELSGVNGLSDTSRGIAAAWRSHTGGKTEPRMSQALHSLTEVKDPPRPAQGHLRPPRESEYDLLVAWAEAFAREAHLQGADRAESIVTTRLATGWLRLWDDGGPVTMVGLAGPVAGVARIGPVYTPPEHRRRGYATTAVAALSRLVLARDAHTCMLYTDLDNPTSNKIYAEVGYRRFADWEEHAFIACEPGSAAARAR